MSKELEAKINEILTRGVAEVIDKNRLKERLLSGEKLRIKLGIDPTSPNLHLGRAVTLLKLKDLQELGHKIIFIIGDFTGVIGDASDKESERPMLDSKTVEKNLATYKEQAGRFLDLSQAEVHYNSEWLAKLGYKEIAEQADIFSVAEFNARENVKNRLQNGARVSLREMLYPLLQGYDSVMVKADLELGGTDQRFNLLAGREMQKHYGQNSQDILMVNLIEGTDGRKMSSSWGNTINILDEPNDIFGKVMSIPDELIIKYFIHCTRTSMESVKKMEKDMAGGKFNPRDAKLELATEIVKIYHGTKEAEKAQKYFINTFSKKEIPNDVQVVPSPAPEVSVLDYMVEAGLAKSKSDARRKIEQGGVEIDGKRMIDTNLTLDERYDGKVIKGGKIHFVRIKFSK
ncbi:MAG: tyrosine--tRNA ligase [Patescibacteria group bacterium]